MSKKAINLLVILVVLFGPPAVVQAQNGMSIWTNLYVGPGSTEDRPMAVAADTNGNVFVTGVSGSSSGGSDYATMKYASTGAPLWTNRYNGPWNGSDSAAAVAVDTGGNVIVTGQAYVTATDISYATIKYSNAGIPQWTNLYAAGTVGGATGIGVDTNGNVFVTGSSNLNFVTIKYSSVGSRLWVKSCPSGAGGNNYIAVDVNGDVVVAGTTNATDNAYITLKYSGATGTPLWTNTYNGGSGAYKYDKVTALAVDGAGSVYVTGKSQAGDGHYEFATLKITNGAPAWIRRYSRGTAQPAVPVDLVVDASGNAFVTGTDTTGS